MAKPYILNYQNYTHFDQQSGSIFLLNREVGKRFSSYRAVSKLSDLWTASRAVLWVNALTLYRIVAFPVLLGLIFVGRFDIFKWVLIVNFLTDALDGYLARKLKATSVLGARLDSIGDDLTVLAAMIGLWVARSEFIKAEMITFLFPLALFFVQAGCAYFRYGKMTSFHTYGAKAAAILQGFFLCSMFLFEQPLYWLFYTTAVVTSIELLEEIAIVYFLREWKTNVKGIYWVVGNR